MEEENREEGAVRILKKAGIENNGKRKTNLKRMEGVNHLLLVQE